MKLYVDAHLHIDKNADLEISPEIGMVFLNSTSPEDYHAVRKASSGKNIIPFYGLHPWNVRDNLFSPLLLSDILSSNPTAGIGETGLDSTRTHKASRSLQNILFKQQLDIAVKYRRCISIHCVRAWQQLFETLEASGSLSKPFLVHSFYGSVEILSRLLNTGCYISLSSLSLRNPEKSWPVISKIPLNRLLVESDFICGSPGWSSETHLHEIKNIYNIVSSILGIPESELRARILENGTLFTN